MGAIGVNALNFVRAETDRMFAGVLGGSGGVGKWWLVREPSPLDQQTVIRLNRDTLYASVVADISQGATLTLPDAGDRYMSAMVINQDHYVNRVYHSGGSYELTVDEFDTPYVVVAVRILVNPADAADVAMVKALQDQLRLDAPSNAPFAMPDYDKISFDATRTALIELARGIDTLSDSFGPRDRVNPIKHLIETAAAWGGLPDTEATYLNVDPGLLVEEYSITVGDVPVDAFWSTSVYNAEGFFQPNDFHSYNINSVTGARNPDGTITVNFGTGDGEKSNYLPIMEGWNYMVRLYRPRPEILEGRWTFPAIEAV